ncbi:MAG: HAD-IIB family hydrolase [Oscillospiraceae bacterium]|nr:HAD-IIB family hydrolase [Oscillospiraceae bacterium]
MIDYDSIKILAADIDGTLVEKGGVLGSKTRAALEEFHHKGSLFGVATGRPLDSRVTSWNERMGLSFQLDFAIGLNGGELWTRQSNQIRRFHLLPKETVKEIISFAETLDVNIIVYGAGYDLMLARRMDDILERSIQRNNACAKIVPVEQMYNGSTGKVELRYDPVLEEEVQNMVAAHPSELWTATRTSEGITEFMDPRVSKGNALYTYCRENNIDLKYVLACGDMENDIPLMQIAGHSICLQNGSDEAKAAADFVTSKPVWEDGLGDYFLETGLFR